MTAEETWHQALAYAVTGQRLEGLGRQAGPDVTGLAAELRTRLARGEVTVLNAASPVPDDLLAGLGAAQFWAALRSLRQVLAGPDRLTGVVTDRPLTADERRLDLDRPPHHGG